jgi:hypothetical protein
MEPTVENTRKPDQVQARPGVVTHAAYSLRRLVRLSKPKKRSDREMLAGLRLAYAIAAGFPSWESTPQPVREVIDMAVELSLFRRALFSGFWSGREIPKRYDGVTELLRRVLVTLGLGSQGASTPDVAALLAGMPSHKARR